MKLPEGFYGYAIAKVCEVYSSPYDITPFSLKFGTIRQMKLM